MKLTRTQADTLKAAILAEPGLQADVAAGNDNIVAAWLNDQTTFVVWRSAVPMRELIEAITWTEVDALTVNKARIFEWMSRLPVVDASVNKVRKGLEDCFGTNSATLPAMLAVMQRTANRGESLLAVGAGTSADPAKLRVEGMWSNTDVSMILRG